MSVSARRGLPVSRVREQVDNVMANYNYSTS